MIHNKIYLDIQIPFSVFFFFFTQPRKNSAQQVIQTFPMASPNSSRIGATLKNIKKECLTLS
jgi:hypothetical protein